ncbi:sugar phosphate nucleotidyltransferase [Geminicoccus flavidas]|uniref:sugar phosphate nucleotidyltransferase n=1 Tax=Geminicoccus flavidas TaxID=2506407 RepID=UPI0013579723|nr:sugar phosphate nucleotidyltransferase [Geminicoccus flavidas]
MKRPDPFRPAPADVPVFILCGGLGTRLGHLAADRPKPMVEIGDRPMLQHIMEVYGRHGFRRFVLCAGWRSEVIGEFFGLWHYWNADFTVNLRDRSVSWHQTKAWPDWDVTVAQTGPGTMTGARIARAAARYLGDAPHFAVTYGDGLTDADLTGEFAFHLAHDRLATMLGVQPPSQFGRLDLPADGPARFVEKPERTNQWINGGYFFFRRGMLDYLSERTDCVLEGEPLQRLSADGQLEVHKHGGFWSCMDTSRDKEKIEALWETGAAPWTGQLGGLIDA